MNLENFPLENYLISIFRWLGGIQGVDKQQTTLLQGVVYASVGHQQIVAWKLETANKNSEVQPRLLQSFFSTLQSFFSTLAAPIFPQQMTRNHQIHAQTSLFNLSNGELGNLSSKHWYQHQVTFPVNEQTLTIHKISKLRILKWGLWPDPQVLSLNYGNKDLPCYMARVSLQNTILL